MVGRISSALVVALALVAACGQKPQQQESTMKAPNVAAIADDEVQFAILDYVHAKMEGHYDKEAEFLATLQAFSDSYKVSKLGPLDERFYKLDENLSALIVAKIRADPASFSLQ